MALLTDQQKTELRQACAGFFATVNYTKADIGNALQALEDWFDDPATKTEVSSRIDIATSPFVFTNAQKKAIAKFWLRSKFGRE